uniref:SHSP domain-containing protein n=1 Tax=Oryza glaberrima TaxID=4538 RepID=I1QB34_ORYGL
MSAGRRPPPRTSTPPASPVINQKHHLIESFGALISLIDTKRGMVGLGVRKEEIRVEVEDAMYLVIRTELDDGGDGDGGGGGGRRSFARKFRLPAMVDADGISAEYTHGVLRVTVPRLHTRARPVVNLAAGGGGGGGPACDPVARAA